MRKNKMIPVGLLFLIMAIPAQKLFSQNIPADSIKSMLIKDWERAKAYTAEYMNAMPAEKYSFRPTDSVRSFAQQLLHLSNANMFFASAATGAKMMGSPDLEKRTSAQSADSVKYYVNNSYDFTINAVKNLPPAALMEIATVNTGQAVSATKLSWLLKSFEHQTHHRGQTTVYLRLAGVRPPAERLF